MRVIAVLHGVFLSLLLSLFVCPHGLAWDWVEAENHGIPDDSWQSMRTFRLENPQVGSIILVYVAQSEQSPNLKAYVEDGMAQWSQALNGRLRYRFTRNPQEAQIKVYGVSGFPEPDQAGNTVFGFGEALIQIKIMRLPENIIHGNVLHELGHALGIAGHSEHNTDIMKSGRTWSSASEYHTYQPKLTVRDQWAIQRLYSTAWQPGEDLYARQASQRPLKTARHL